MVRVIYDPPNPLELADIFQFILKFLEIKPLLFCVIIISLQAKTDQGYSSYYDL
jgi:hypothetical protein